MEDINFCDFFLVCYFLLEMVCVVLMKNFVLEVVLVLDG